ncbi:hypothetical protein SCHPADRAFT_936030 [Schizopora paradoxa]|uniref:Uncharacterized protein n=1 Tax=Schizopora paradoxa TaxID=27342 RepID=A0A0H2SN89_9AGAM|nr:hypothetical protein SCHPADRAFT_936030 [Schizopora paradoxa]
MKSERPSLLVVCDSNRPNLKRQTTAPIPSDGHLKRQRGNEQVEFIAPDVIHAAFLSELQNRSRTHLPKSPYPFEDSIHASPKDINFHEHVLASSPKSCGSSINSQFSDDSGTASIQHSPIDGLQSPVQPEFSISMLSEMTISSPCNTFTSLSIARRRQARDGVQLDFHVQIPRNTYLEAQQSSAEDGDIRLSPSCLFDLGSKSSMNPITPAERGMSTPVVPKAPRLIDFRGGSFAKSRWLPTPNEGVLPTVNLASMTPPSPTTNTRVSKSATLDSKIHPGTTRPSLVNRSLSWLSYRQLPGKQSLRANESDTCFNNTELGRNPLESPFEHA